MGTHGSQEGATGRGAESQALHCSRHSAPPEGIQESGLHSHPVQAACVAMLPLHVCHLQHAGPHQQQENADESTSSSDRQSATPMMQCRAVKHMARQSLFRRAIKAQRMAAGHLWELVHTHDCALDGSAGKQLAVVIPGEGSLQAQQLVGRLPRDLSLPRSCPGLCSR